MKPSLFCKWSIAIFIFFVHTLAQAEWVGDCQRDGTVTVDELVRAVGIALGEISLQTCWSADANSDGEVLVNELILAETNALSGSHLAVETYHNSTRTECEVLSGRGRLKYFGFYCSACSWVGVDSYFNSFTDEIKDFANLTWIAGDVNWIIPELKKAQEQKISAIVSTLYHDMSEAGWNDFQTLLRPYVESGTLIGLYMADDYFANISETERQIAMIKDTFPQIKTVAILVSPPSQLPKGIDWVGLESYACWSGGKCDFDDEEENQNRNDQMYRNYKLLKSMLSSSQSIVLVPNVSLINAFEPQQIMSSNAVDWSIDKVLEFGLDDPQVVAIVPFLWQSMNTVQLLTGARDLPGFTERVIDLGMCFKNP